MLLETIFCRTRKGALALVEPGVALSPGFRQFLKLVNGSRSGGDLLASMPQLDLNDLAMWVDELRRMDLIAVEGELAVDDIAFQLTSTMKPLAPRTGPVDTNLIDDIVVDVKHAIGPAPPALVEERLRQAGRMAAIESVSSFNAVGRSGFFVYPNAAEGLPGIPRICIAGHDAAQNDLLHLALQRAGVELKVCGNRADLQAVLRSDTPPHVLLTDAEMPKLDGFKLLQLISTKREFADMHVVLISERGERADLARALMLGAAGYIVKPLRQEVLEVAMPQIIGRPLR